MNKSMTTEKALEILQEIKCDFKNKCCTSIDLGNIEAIDVAISALEKQIQKKVNIIENFRDANGCIAKKGKCPCCDNLVIDYIEEYGDVDSCFKCGQALDWSDEE